MIYRPISIALIASPRSILVGIVLTVFTVSVAAQDFKGLPTDRLRDAPHITITPRNLNVAPPRKPETAGTPPKSTASSSARDSSLAKSIVKTAAPARSSTELSKRTVSLSRSTAKESPDPELELNRRLDEAKKKLLAAEAERERKLAQKLHELEIRLRLLDRELDRRRRAAVNEAILAESKMHRSSIGKNIVPVPTKLTARADDSTGVTRFLLVSPDEVLAETQEEYYDDGDFSYADEDCGDCEPDWVGFPFDP